MVVDKPVAAADAAAAARLLLVLVVVDFMVDVVACLACAQRTQVVDGSRQ
jgi:hypothetical protein